MTRKKIYIIANWKMNPGTPAEAKKLFASVKRGIGGIKTVEVGVCPPFPYLGILSAGKNPALGAQDCFWGDTGGAYTSGVSAAMLKNLGCRYVILGHSERREYFGDSDDLINKKVKAALRAKLCPIIAVGEKTRKTFTGSGLHTNELDAVLEEQVSGALRGVASGHLKDIIFAYEPVWAISRGEKDHVNASPDEVFAAVLYIRKIITSLYSKTIAKSMSILYGGSTDSKNLPSFLNDGRADGALVGNASTDAEEFIKMVQAAESFAKGVKSL